MWTLDNACAVWAGVRVLAQFCRPLLRILLLLLSSPRRSGTRGHKGGYNTNSGPDFLLNWLAGTAAQAVPA
jgi:hypothetical protein